MQAFDLTISMLMPCHGSMSNWNFGFHWPRDLIINKDVCYPYLIGQEPQNMEKDF